MKKASLLLAGAAVIGSAVAAPHAYAQDGEDDARSASLDQIFVTARKREERLQDVPIAISAFSGDQLVRKSITDTVQLFDAVPNLNLYRRGAYVPVPVIRGVYAGVQDPTSEPSVGFYVDDVYIPAANQLDMALLDVERVEVLRGPQGTLYGRNSLGGAIKIVTKKPSDEFSASARVKVGNRNLIDASAGVSGPIVDGALHGRVAAALRRTSGFLYNTALDRNVEHEDFKGVVVSLRATPNENFTADLSMDLMRSSPSTGNKEAYEDSFLELCRANPVGVLGPGCPPLAAGFGYDANTTPFDNIITYDIESLQEQEGEGVSLRLAYDLGGVELVSVTGWRHFEVYMEEDRDGSAYPIVAPFNQTFESKAVSQEIRLSSQGDGRLNWTLGAYGFWDKRDLHMIAGSARPNVFTIAPFPPFAAGLPAGSRLALFNSLLEETTDLDSSSLAVFGQATYDLTSNLSLTVGGRYTWEERDITLVSECDMFQCPVLTVNLPTGGMTTIPPSQLPITPLTDSNDEQVFTPLATLSFNPTEDVLLFATASKGFKSGGYAPVFTFAVRPFDSEVAWNYEVGAKTSWFDNRMTFNLSAFYFDWDDVQINNFTQTAGFVVQNASGAKHKGIEIEWAAVVTESLTIGAAYGFLDAKYKGDLSPPCSATLTTACSIDQSLRRIGTPKHSVSAYAQFQHPVTPDWDFLARVDMNLKTDILMRIDTIGTPTDPGAVNTGRLLRDTTYDVFNGRIGLQSDGWSVAIWATNLFNENYYVAASEFAGAVSAAYGYLGQPRTYGAELSVNF